MSLFTWILCLSGFSLLFWVIARGKGGGQRKKREAESQLQIKELRHVVTEMAMEKHHSTH